jgi:hypothetical protein
MNIHDRNFSPTEAVIRYLDGDYVVVRPGNFVRCAITGRTVPLDELMYWNVDRQEPYADADAALEAYRRHGLSGK